MRNNILYNHIIVCIRGGGDLATGVAFRLIKAGFPVIVFELPRPLVIRRTVAFAQAVFAGAMEVNGVKAQLANTAAEALELAGSGVVSVLVDPAGVHLTRIQPAALVDARMAKRNPGDIGRQQAPLVIALGPGYTAGKDCHAVIETNRGHNLGRVIWSGSAEPNTGVPGIIAGYDVQRVLRAPADGSIKCTARIGDRVSAEQVLATVNDQAILAPFDGVLRGILHEGIEVTAGQKIGDVDPRGDRFNCFTISDKALAIGGGVVEAVLSAPQIRSLLAGDGQKT